jgi:glycosyltransferase involved in cell wall biosynthesis
VSVLLPVKNGLPFLHDAIASLVAQTHPDVEILVIDDGSTDGGPQEVVAQALSHVRVIKSNGQGVAAALNAGLRAATGAFIARQDADDWSHPERLARQFEYLTQHANIDVLATCAEFVDREGRPVETTWTMSVRREQDTAQTSPTLAALLPVRSALTHGSIMARREVLREAGGYRPQAVYAEDYDLWLRLLPNARFAKLPTRLYTYRLHDVTVSQQYRDIQQRSTIRAKLEYLQRRYPNLPQNPRLLLAGEPRDLAAWREIASDLKFTLAATTLPASPESLAPATLRTALDDADVIAIVDLDTLSEWITRMAEDDSFAREGNFFVRSR